LEQWGHSKTSTEQNIDRAKHRQSKTSTEQNINQSQTCSAIGGNPLAILDQ
jgi:hypothetical protein